MSESKILVIGSSNTDMVICTGHLPLPGETVIGGTFFMNPGGKGANQAVTVARLGGRVSFICKTGSDIFGHQANQLFNEEGIDTSYVFSDTKNPSGVALITVDTDAENCIVVAPGANAHLTPNDLKRSAEAVEAADIILLQLEIPMQTVEAAAMMAYRLGKKVVLNPAPASKLSAGLRVCDLGCGTGLLGLLLLQRQSELTITGIDIQPAAVALAERAAAENRLTDRLTFQSIDLRQVRQHFSTGSFDLVVCNPPYYPPASGKVSEDSARRTARSETEASLADICAAASYLLRWGGKFCLVHKPERLTDTACALREAGMEPKRLRFVQNRPDTAPSLFLIEGCRGGKPGVDIQPPLLLQTDTGAPTGELNVIYFRDQEV